MNQNSANIAQNTAENVRQIPRVHMRPMPDSYPNERNEAPEIGERARETFLRRLRCIPKFNGEKYQDLKDFVDIVDTLYHTCVNRVEENELYDQMILQLRGEGKILIMNLVDADWSTIKDTLLSHFSYLSNQNILTSQLENLHQDKNESLNEYAIRTRKLLGDKNATYTFLSHEHRLEHNRLARRAFPRGLNETKLKDRLLTRGANSLEDAIAYVIEAENDALTMIPNSELYCGSSRSNGHRERNCKRKLGDSTIINSLVTALKSFSVSNGRSTSNFTTNGNWRNANRFNNRNSWGRNPNNGNNIVIYNNNNSNNNNNKPWNSNRNEGAPRNSFQRNDQNKNGQTGGQPNQKRDGYRPGQNNFGAYYSPKIFPIPISQNEAEN